MRHSVGKNSLPGLLLTLVALVGSGCSSVLSTASLKDLVWDPGDHAAELEPADEVMAEAAEEQAASAVEMAAADVERREAAVEEAVERLARLGELPPAVRMTLVETLERTEQEDWPTVVDAFAESLAASDLAPAVEPAAEVHTVAKADLDAAGGQAALAIPPSPAESDRAADTATISEPLPVASAAAANDEVTTMADPSPALAMAATNTAPEPPVGNAPAGIAATEQPSAESLTIQNACFASRVQAWGILDRFASDRFRPGQEVIVYFELDGLSAGESSAGHTTCIDSTLRLAADENLIREWSFEPIAETCRARRHDYFARYVVRIPDDAPAGPCQIELAVTDTLSGEQATTLLPLEISRP
jgi:hypothetical protein